MSTTLRTLASALHYLLMVGGGFVLAVPALAAAPVAATLALATGWITASFSEYAVHRWLMHGDRFIARVHAAHHAMPDFDQIDFVSYFGPIAVAVAGWAAVAAITGSLAAAAGFAAGLGFGYSYFRLLHRLMHLPHPPALIAGLTRVHERHHECQSGNFGVTTRIWDRAFGTALRQQVTATAASGEPSA